MTGNDNIISVAIRGDASSYVASLKEAGGVTGSAASQIREEMSSLGSGAQQAEPHLSGLNGALREWRTHVRTEARFTQFMAMQIANLGIAGKGAAAELTGLVSAFAFGGGFGVAIEGAKLLAHFIGEIGKAEKEANDTIKQYGVDAAKSIKSVTEQIDKMIMSLRHASTLEVLRHDVVAPLLRDEQDRKNELIAATDKLAEARSSASYSVQSEKELNAAIANQTRAVREATAAYEDARAKRRAAQQDVGRGVKAETGLDKSIEDAKLAAAEATIESEINLDRIKTEQERSEAKKTATFKTALEKEIAEAQLRASQASEESEINKLRIYTEQELAEKKVAAAEQAIADKTKEVMKTAQPFENAFKGAFRSIIDGTKDVGQVMTDLGKNIILGVVDDLITMATKTIAAALASKVAAVSATQGYIAEAVAGAAASQAFIPFVGPELAAAAAATMAGTLEGLTAPMLSAAGGLGTVPHDTLAYVHKNETILPADLAEKYRDGAPGSGGGSASIEVHINAIDGASVFRVVNSAEFAYSLKEAARRGRLR